MNNTDIHNFFLIDWPNEIITNPIEFTFQKITIFAVNSLNYLQFTELFCLEYILYSVNLNLFVISE